MAVWKLGKVVRVGGDVSKHQTNIREDTVKDTQSEESVTSPWYCESKHSVTHSLSWRHEYSTARCRSSLPCTCGSAGLLTCSVSPIFWACLALAASGLVVSLVLLLRVLWWMKWMKGWMVERQAEGCDTYTEDSIVGSGLPYCGWSCSCDLVRGWETWG